jgi:hypothetical protein
MSKLLRDLLDAKEPLFTLALRQLEQDSGKKNIDVKLTAELIEKTHAAIRGLGLDSQDTVDKELYFALDHKVLEHNEHLAKSLGTSNDAPVKELVPKLVEAANQVKTPRSAWVG